MATRDADEQRQYDEEQHRRAEEHHQLYQQLDDARERGFDGDDASCVCLEDLEERKDFEDEGPELPNVQSLPSMHISSASSSAPQAPSNLAHAPPHSSILSGSSDFSWVSNNSKRRLSGIDDSYGGDSNSESEGHASKKMKPLLALFSGQLQLEESASTAQALENLEFTKPDDGMFGDDLGKAPDAKERTGEGNGKRRGKGTKNAKEPCDR